MKPFSVGESQNLEDGKFWAYDHPQYMTEPFAIGKKSNKYNVMQGDTLSPEWEHLFTFWTFNPDKGMSEDDVRSYTKLEQKRRSYPCSNVYCYLRFIYLTRIYHLSSDVRRSKITKTNLRTAANFFE